MSTIESGIVVLNGTVYPHVTLREYVSAPPAISYQITGGDYHDTTPVGDRWEHRRWTIHLYNPANGKRMQFGFMTGMAHEKPEIAETLWSTFRDAQSVEWEAFGPDWADDRGYAPEEYRMAERIYKACERMNDRLDAFYGEDRDAWEQFIEEAGA